MSVYVCNICSSKDFMSCKSLSCNRLMKYSSVFDFNKIQNHFKFDWFPSYLPILKAAEQNKKSIWILVVASWELISSLSHFLTPVFFYCTPLVTRTTWCVGERFVLHAVMRYEVNFPSAERCAICVLIQLSYSNVAFLFRALALLTITLIYLDSNS